MKLMLVALGILSQNALAEIPSQMSEACYQKLIPLVEDSVQASKYDILSDLKYDWRLHTDVSIAKYEECGPSDYYYITIDKLTCTVVDSGSGDSDGECD